MQQIISTQIPLSSNGIFNNHKHYPPLHIIIPAYNESRSIISVIRRIESSLMLYPYQFRITVIDDGSSDSTYEILQNSNLNISLKKNHQNLGKGKTMRRGILQSKKEEIVVMIDGDGEHIPEDISRLIDPILTGKADCVIGSRFLPRNSSITLSGSYLKNQKKHSYFRKAGNNLISFLIYTFFRRWITDSQCGFRAFAPDIAKLYKPTYSGFEIETEMTLFYILNNFKIVEIPIDTGLNTRESHMNILKDSMKILFVILSLRFKKFDNVYQKIRTKILK
ncbi:Undecaprenyl-phosphate 4-deoxy-4-formamido-L-arabinose transferase [Candidatus Lokiarchaeum ossiferum]|uniref:Undecaprenyl-phosphate 4-deoxy-4-formamido-L-arabinose transferase n=1 Tax=Candidatus Lokiarchaeum ossiferum TaxID=2951803 RepID=A0ABY6HZH9_9ARCH|nr:Undecaprenyl-phosphate 4-deoxy-4-formamido-L-arabinose transferase [Candidatus Lokiarchaeum sp. B-35]